MEMPPYHPGGETRDPVPSSPSPFHCQLPIQSGPRPSPRPTSALPVWVGAGALRRIKIPGAPAWARSVSPETPLSLFLSSTLDSLFLPFYLLQLIRVLLPFSVDDVGFLQSLPVPAISGARSL